MRTDLEIMEEICEAELEGLSQAELEGAHTALCGLLLIRTALDYRGGLGGRRFSKWAATRAKAIARQWQEGGIGEWTFESVCSALGMSPCYARRQIAGYAEAAGRPAINSRPAPTQAETGLMEFDLLADVSPDTPDSDYWDDHHANHSPEAAAAH